MEHANHYFWHFQQIKIDWNVQYKVKLHWLRVLAKKWCKIHCRLGGQQPAQSQKSANFTTNKNLSLIPFPQLPRGQDRLTTAATWNLSMNLTANLRILTGMFATGVRPRFLTHLTKCVKPLWIGNDAARLLQKSIEYSGADQHKNRCSARIIPSFFNSVPKQIETMPTPYSPHMVDQGCGNRIKYRYSSDGYYWLLWYFVTLEVKKRPKTCTVLINLRHLQGVGIASKVLELCIFLTRASKCAVGLLRLVWFAELLTSPVECSVSKIVSLEQAMITLDDLLSIMNDCKLFKWLFEDTGWFCE